MLTLHARIRLKTKEESSAPFHPTGFSWMQLSLSVKGELIACKLLRGPPGAVIPPGEWCDAGVQLAYGEVYKETLVEGFEFNLNVGGVVVGTGVITRVVG